MTLFITYAGDHHTLPFPKHSSISETRKSKHWPGNVDVFPELTISLAGKEKGENLNLNVPPCTHTHMHIYLLPKDASGSIKIPDPLA